MLSDPCKAVAKAWSKGYLERRPSRSTSDRRQTAFARSQVMTHFSNLASTLPVFTSIIPTNLTTLPSFLASSLKADISSSPSSSLSMYSSLLLHSAKAAGTSERVGREAYPSGRVECGSVESGRRRERMVSFRATSEPERSSLGSGSYAEQRGYVADEPGRVTPVDLARLTVYPLSLAILTTSENLTSPPSTLLNSLKM